jgi:predicted SnoaL-like aldol condensation-catalyzing enzyme
VPTVADYKAMAQRWFSEVLTEGKMDAIDELCYDFVRFENDRAVEHWGVIDSAALMEQIGAVPAAS